MAVWELSLLVLAVTVFVVNMIQVTVGLYMLAKFGGVFDKSVKLMEKMMKGAEKTIDEMFNDEE